MAAPPPVQTFLASAASDWVQAGPGPRRRQQPQRFDRPDMQRARILTRHGTGDDRLWGPEGAGSQETWQ